MEPGYIAFIKIITKEDMHSDGPIKSKVFDYDEEDIIYDTSLQNFLASCIADENFLSKDIEVFETKGNHAFTSDGIYATVYSEDLKDPTDELTGSV